MILLNYQVFLGALALAKAFVAGLNLYLKNIQV